MRILNPLFNIGRSIKIPGLQGLSLYDVLEMYIIGIVKGALTTRAGAISYSFFMSLFPFLLFVLNLMAVVSFIDYNDDILPLLESVFPPNTLDVFQDTIANIFEKKRVGLFFFYKGFFQGKIKIGGGERKGKLKKNGQGEMGL